MSKHMPKQKRWASNQSVETPDDFIMAVQYCYGMPSFDLAADDDNKKAQFYYDEEDDSLTRNWHELDGLLWLNPPFANITPWAAKCAKESAEGAHVLLLVPASVGSNWFMDHVYGIADVVALNGRLTFKGCKDAYPKDCILCEFSPATTGQFSVWDWKDTLEIYASSHK